VELAVGDPGVIGVFAKMFGHKERIEEVSVREGEAGGYEVRSSGPEDLNRITVAEESVPEHFVEKVPSEGGSVLFVPFLEALRRSLKRRTE